MFIVFTVDTVILEFISSVSRVTVEPNTVDTPNVDT